MTLSSEWSAALEPISDRELRDALAATFRRAAELAMTRDDHGRPTLVVLVSRRLTCVYDMLVAAGMSLFDAAEVVSDRVLDAESMDLGGRRVILLDDSLVLGTTLVDLFDRVVQLVGRPELVTTLVACVDGERFNENFARHVGIAVGDSDLPLIRATKELEAFSYELASCLYRAGIPYFTDFPLVRQLRLERSFVEHVLRSEDWFAADVTPPAGFAGDQRRGYSLVPRSDTGRRIRARVPPAASQLAELLKVRLYCRDEGADHFDVRIVPIGIPGAVMVPALNDALEQIAVRLRDNEESLRWRTWTPVAKHRLLQMYLSSCVLTEFWDTVGMPHVLEPDVLDQRHLHYYFGAGDSPKVLDAFVAAVDEYRSAPADAEPPQPLVPLVPRSGLAAIPDVRRRAAANSELVAATQLLRLDQKLEVLADAIPPPTPSAGDVTTVDLLWAHRILLIFGFVDHELERPQEAILRTYTYEEYADHRRLGHDERIGPRVIKLGITAHELRPLLLPHLDCTDTWNAAVLSLAIDVGNDLGVIVPSTTCQVEGYGPVYRQYRSGETACIAGLPHEDARTGADIDLYTRWVLEDQHRDVGQFLSETREIADTGLFRGSLVQIWDGEVLEHAGDVVRVRVHSRLNDGEVDVAALPASMFRSPHTLAAGDVIEWVITESQDPLGRTRRTSQVRSTAAA